MQNLILSLPKQESNQMGVYLSGLEDMIADVTEATRIVFTVEDTGCAYEIKSEYPYVVASYALAMSCLQTLMDLIESEERFDAIVRCN